MKGVALDASALLALLLGEAGAEVVLAALPSAVVSAVNHSETLSRLVRGGADCREARAQLDKLGFQVMPFTLAQSAIAAELYVPCRSFGLSFADRACLALALERDLPVLTADRAWIALGLDLGIRLIR